MNQETNNKPIRITRRATRSRTQAIFFSRSTVEGKEIPDEVLITDKGSEAATCPEEGEGLKEVSDYPHKGGPMDDRKRMFSFKELLGMFSGLENGEKQKPFCIRTSRIDTAGLSQKRGAIVKRRMEFESLVENREVSRAQGSFCTPKGLAEFGDK